MNELGELFNAYHTAFTGLTRETANDIDISAGPFRIRLYGAESRKNAAWNESREGKIYFATVSSSPIEIWGDIREVASGENEGALVVNNLGLGHEFVHAMRVLMADWRLRDENDGVLLSPDKYAGL